MTQELIRQLFNTARNADSLEAFERVAAALLSPSIADSASLETELTQLKSLYETDCGFDTGWRMACDRFLTLLKETSIADSAGAKPMALTDDEIADIWYACAPITCSEGIAFARAVLDEHSEKFKTVYQYKVSDLSGWLDCDKAEFDRITSSMPKWMEARIVYSKEPK